MARDFGLLTFDTCPRPMSAIRINCWPHESLFNKLRRGLNTYARLCILLKTVRRNDFVTKDLAVEVDTSQNTKTFVPCN